MSPAAPPRPADAEAVRDALDEFEAAVERAHRDSETGSHHRPVFEDDVATHKTASNPRTTRTTPRKERSSEHVHR